MPNDHEDGLPHEHEERVDQRFVDTEPPTSAGHSTPIVAEYDGFPPPAKTGDALVDLLLPVVTELRDSVRDLTRRVGQLESAVERSRLTDEADQRSMRTAIQNASTAVENLRKEFCERTSGVEGRVSSLEEWRETKANGG